MAFNLNGNQKLNVYISKNCLKSVFLASKDLISDINKTIKNVKIKYANNIENANIIISTKDCDNFNEINKFGCKFLNDEEFLYSISDNKIVFLGSDDLGTMWAIYSFIENELKIPPFYFFDDFKFTKQNEIVLQNKVINEYPKTKFRGWFINDEDLLSGFKTKGKRYIVNYPFYHKIQSPFMVKKIVETALRFKINLIIPATLVDITNKAEENLVKLVTERGLYVSQHHIEPMGVSHYGYSKFAKQHNYEDKLSFTTHKDEAIECWTYYCKKWAKYDRVVWQLGLRGAGDLPVWKTDTSIADNDKARGELISNAIKTQYDIIASNVKGKFYSTSTLWMEGADLLEKGVLTFPKDTIIVFADIGISQMFGEDFFKVKRQKNTNYGVYYHSNYWHVGPHLSEGVLPKKIDYSYKLAREYNSTYYSVLNVGNVKEFTFSININSKIVWYQQDITLDRIIDDYCNLYDSDNSSLLKQGIFEYYKGLGEIDEQRYIDFCKKYNFNYHKYENLDFPVININDGIAFWIGRFVPFNLKVEWYTADFGKMVDDSIEHMQQSYKIFEEVCKNLPTTKQNALQKQWLNQSNYFLQLYLMFKENIFAIKDYKNNNKKGAISHYENAINHVENIIEYRKTYYKGFWKNWFRNETKLDAKLLIFCQNEQKESISKL